jgi:hypothetical protein
MPALAELVTVSISGVTARKSKVAGVSGIGVSLVLAAAWPTRLPPNR